VTSWAGGDVFAPTTSKDLPPIYERILDDMAAQYVLGFISDSPRRDGHYRKLKVEAKQKDLKLRHRAGYYAPVGRSPGGYPCWSLISSISTAF
jgi:VWFA-related protein